MGAYAAGILIVTGALTAVPLLGAVAPRAALRVLLGAEEPEPIAVLFARHWLLLIGLVGCLLLYSAAHPQVRFPALIVGVVEKLVFALLVFSSPLRRRAVTALAAAADALMAALFIALLAAGAT